MSAIEQVKLPDRLTIPKSLLEASRKDYQPSSAVVLVVGALYENYSETRQRITILPKKELQEWGVGHMQQCRALQRLQERGLVRLRQNKWDVVELVGELWNE